MKRMLILGISMLFILTAFTSVEAVNINNNLDDLVTSTISDEMTIKVHVFKDENENGIQDNGEEDAQFFNVYAKTALPPWWEYIKDFVGQTDSQGNLEFDWSEGRIFIHAREKQVYIVTQYIGDIGEIPGGLEVYDGIQFEIPCKYVERDSFFKNLEGRSFPLLKRISELFQKIKTKTMNKNAVLDNTNPTESYEITVHTFYDYNENGVQDSNEDQANNIRIYAKGPAPDFYVDPYHFRGITSNGGYLTFTYEDSRASFCLHGRQKAGFYMSNQYKGDLGGMGGKILVDGKTYELPLKYVKTESTEKNSHNTNCLR